MTSDSQLWAPMDFANLTTSLSGEEPETNHKVLSDLQELTLVLLYTLTGAIGLVSNITLIVIILGEI